MIKYFMSVISDYNSDWNNRSNITDNISDEIYYVNNDDEIVEKTKIIRN
jgi:hypothetical protein